MDKRNQKPGETVADLCVAIQKLSEFCEFGTTLNDALRDRLVCGLVNEQIQRRLLVEADLTYDRAKAIAIAAETATKDAVELRQPSAPLRSDVNKLKSTSTRAGATQASSTSRIPHDAGTASCTRCGRKNHKQSECYFRDKACHRCPKIGHTKRMCKSSTSQPMNRQRNKAKVHHIEPDSASDTDGEYVGMLNYVVTSDVTATKSTLNIVTVQPIMVKMSIRRC